MVGEELHGSVISRSPNVAKEQTMKSEKGTFWQREHQA